MEYKILGRTGVKVSSFCLGTDNFADPTPEKESIQILETAIDAGINLLDTGDVYADGEGERIIGKALQNNGKQQASMKNVKFKTIKLSATGKI